MKRIIASRGTGKSTELLRMALEDKNAAIAVPNANYIRMYCVIANGVLGIPIEKIHEIVDCAEIDGVLVAPFFDFINHPKCSAFNRRNVYIDELELCIKWMMVYHNFVGYTLSIEQEKKNAT